VCERGYHVLVHVAAVALRCASVNRHVAVRDWDLLAGCSVINAAIACGLGSAQGTGPTCRRRRNGRRFGLVDFRSAQPASQVVCRAVGSRGAPVQQTRDLRYRRNGTNKRVRGAVRDR
jgi:hypothetical protein